MKRVSVSCPLCRQRVVSDPFYCVAGQPANSVMLCQSFEDATTISRGDIALLHCPFCGFIFNSAYEPQLCIYDRKYEETQAHSHLFKAFDHELATRLLTSYRLYNKIILEIGCGKGDFLNLLCRMGNNRGIGYDPSYVAERSQTAATEQVVIYNRFFPEHYTGEQPDCIICKMTLEHIGEVHSFLGCVRRAIASGNSPAVFFQVPDVGPILEELRFWDIYYEHCSYFTCESLTRLFQLNGFRVLTVTSGYDRQYLMLEALLQESPAGAVSKSAQENDVMSLTRSFSAAVSQHIRGWQQLLEAWQKRNKKVVLWGGGSKAVAFLATVQCFSAVDGVVDINPHKQGKYLPGSGHQVIAPESLVSVQPDIILVMNPVYMEEIRNQVVGLGIKCELLPLINEPKQIMNNE